MASLTKDEVLDSVRSKYIEATGDTDPVTYGNIDDKIYKAIRSEDSLNRHIVYALPTSDIDEKGFYLVHRGEPGKIVVPEIDLPVINGDMSISPGQKSQVFVVYLPDLDEYILFKSGSLYNYGYIPHLQWTKKTGRLSVRRGYQASAYTVARYKPSSDTLEWTDIYTEGTEQSTYDIIPARSQVTDSYPMDVVYVSSSYNYRSIYIDDVAVPYEDPVLYADNGHYIGSGGVLAPYAYDKYIRVKGNWEKITDKPLEAGSGITIEDNVISAKEVDLSDYVKNDDYATNTKAGIGKVQNSFGIENFANFLVVAPATSDEIKLGTQTRKPIDSVHQHESVFYGLAKASGDTTQSASSNPVGQYTDEAKANIQNMLGIRGSSDEIVISSDEPQNAKLWYKLKSETFPAINLATIPTDWTFVNVFYISSINSFICVNTAYSGNRYQFLLSSGTLKIYMDNTYVLYKFEDGSWIKKDAKSTSGAYDFGTFGPDDYINMVYSRNTKNAALKDWKSYDDVTMFTNDSNHKDLENYIYIPNQYDNSGLYIGDSGYIGENKSILKVNVENEWINAVPTKTSELINDSGSSVKVVQLV